MGKPCFNPGQKLHSKKVVEETPTLTCQETPLLDKVLPPEHVSILHPKSEFHRYAWAATAAVAVLAVGAAVELFQYFEAKDK